MLEIKKSAQYLQSYILLLKKEVTSECKWAFVNNRSP